MSFLQSILRNFFVFVLSWTIAQTAQAQNASYPDYPVVKFPGIEGAVAIIDSIDHRTPLGFERLLSRIDNPTVLILDSRGGLVSSALAIAHRVHALGLTTFVPEGRGCYSACALIFFAGKTRNAIGDLGVHQISAVGNNGNLQSGQVTLADISDALNKFDVPPEVFSIMLRTPPEDMYIFDQEQKAQLGFLGTATSSDFDVVKLPKIATPSIVGSQVIESYFTLLSSRDRRNSSGAPITAIAGIIQQDRANYHRFGKADLSDQSDTTFSTLEARRQIPRLMSNGIVSNGLEGLILRGNVLVQIQIIGRNGIPEAINVYQAAQ
ncbi:hypothetical protein WG622_11420 [Cognatishimia sp. D5M38]|uniref:Periplasmic protein-like protein n=1 Tax=Cognatishimia coralii TaxID=3083254 RepID=A0ABU8QHH6_9RHOB